MRPEQSTPPPWERKERKFERGTSGSSSGSGSGDGPPAASAPAVSPATNPRLRDPRYVGSVARDSSRRAPSGQHRLYPEDSPSRSDRFYAEDEGRPGRDNRSSFGPSSNLNPLSSFPRRPSYDPPIATTTRSLPVPVSTASTAQPSPRDHAERDHLLAPLSWKPLKWARPSSGALPAKEESTLKVPAPPVKEAPVASPVTSPPFVDETGASRKKARLGWGQGLAKYEKEKVQGSLDSSSARSGSEACGVAASGAGDAGISGPVTAASCSSPVTHLSATSRPSPAPASTDGITCHQNVARRDTQPCSKDLPSKLDFSVNSVGSLSTLLANLLKPEDACTGDSTFLNKVSKLKVDISKELEKTECEIDSLELELKSLDSKNKPVEDEEAQGQQPIEKMSEPCSKTTKDRNTLRTEELESCSEKQDNMPVGSKIANYEKGQEITGCDDEPSTSKASDNNLALDENKKDAKGANLICSIIASNKDAAKLAAEAIGIVQSEVDIWKSVNVLCSSRTGNMRVKKKLALRKRQIKSKEQLLVLKFMALRQLWKEDIKINFAKSGKRASAVRSRLASPDDNSAPVPSNKILEYSSKLLTSSRIKKYRSYQKMPSLIVDNKEKENRRFPTKNGLIEDPVSFECDRSMINPWTPEEKVVFMEMLASFGKDFSKISSFLDHKTTADCVEFYYKNHKSESFAEVKKKRLLMKKKESQLKIQKQAQSSTFLIATSRKWSQEPDGAAADRLGAASAVAAYNQGTGSKGKQKGSSKSRGNHGAVDRKESVAANVLSSIGRAVSSSEAMSSCVTTSTDPTGKTSHVRPMVEEDSSSQESCGGELVSADWNDEEKALFVQAYNTYGKDFSKISDLLSTRSRDQCKVFFCKAQKSLGLDFTNHDEYDGDVGGIPPGNGDTNGRSDIDDVAAEMDSGICSTQSCSKAAGDMATTSEAVAQPESENANDGPSEQEVVGAVVDSEMYDCLPDKLETGTDGYTDLKEKPVPEKETPVFEPLPNESENTGLTCNKKASLPEIEMKIDPEVVVEQSRMECAEAGSVSALQTTDSCSTYRHEDISEKPIETLKESVGSGHTAVLQHQTGTARSRRHASIDLGRTSSVSDLGTTTSVISFASDAGVCESLHTRPAFGTSYNSQVPLEILPLMLKENNVNNRSVQFGSGPTFCKPSGAICFSGNPPGLSQTTLNFEEHLNKPHYNVAETSNPLQQYMQKSNPIANQNTQLPHVLKGYPLHMPNRNGVKNETDLFGRMKRNEFSQPNQFIGLNAPVAGNNPGAGILTAQKKDELCGFSMRPGTQPVGTTEKDLPCRTGDVKLFGKILTQSSSGKVCRRPPSPKPNPTESSSIMPNKPILSMPNGHSLSMPSFSRPVGVGAGNHLGLDRLPVQSYGFWDGNRIRAGFPSLPDSAGIMAKHQESRVGVLPFYPCKDSNSLSVHVNDQQPHMQQLASKGGRVDGFSRMVLKNSGVEAAQRSAPNVVGAGAGFIRDSDVVSDPVVALRMHYASTAKGCSSSNGSGMEAWRSDVGR